MTTCSLEKTVLQSLADDVDAVVVAVSGGVDSVVLLHLLHRIAAARAGSCPLRLQAVHLDHQIRRDSGDDARFVESLCARLNIPCHSVACDVPALAQQEKISLEMAGRKARRQLLQQVAVKQGAAVIALGHHRDDQIETFLLRLTRGSGLSGLAAMAIRDGIWWRPLLNCSRQQLLDYARQHQLVWREDSSNRDPAYVRNMLRMNVVPVMEEINPRLNERVFDLCRQIASEENYWQQQLDEQFPLMIVDQRDGLRLSRPSLLDCHPALRIRLLREGLRQVRGGLAGIDAVHLQALDALLESTRCQAQLNLPNCWAARRYDCLWLRKDPPPQPAPFCLPVSIPGETPLPDGSRMVVTMVKRPGAESRNSIFVDLAASGNDMLLRNWRPGDRLAPLGMHGHKRLKCLFSELRIEKEQRHCIPLLYCGNNLLWVVGVRRSGHAVADDDSEFIARFDLI